MKETVMSSENLPPQMQFMQMITGHWISKPLYVAAELGIADQLADGAASIDDLARENQVEADTLYRLMRALACVGVFSERENRHFELTPLAEMLKTDAMRSYVQLFNSEWSDRAWSRLMDGLRCGETPFALAHGAPVDVWLDDNPRAAEIFNRANAAKAASAHRGVLEVYDFSGIGSLTDVGGGLGALLAEILIAHPPMSGCLAETPAVAKAAEQALQSRGLGDRCRVVDCDFFTSIPPGADAYLLSNILHDWPDDRCLEILRTCRQAMSAGSRLLILEMLIPAGNSPSLAKLLDLEMLVTTGGRERTAEEFAYLLKSAGFGTIKIKPIGGDLHVLEVAAPDTPV
jgi:O-methyltransferase domain/Dimerisation domain